VYDGHWSNHRTATLPHNEAGVRFLVAGGLAVNAHGYVRFTKDADLVIDLTAENIRAISLNAEQLPVRLTDHDAHS